MVDLDDVVAACVAANAEASPRQAVRDALDGMLPGLHSLPDRLGDEPTSGLQVLHRSPTLTVLNVVWPPKMSLFPHDHRMWAAIGIYRGREDNAFFRRDGDRVVPSGGKELEQGEVLLLGDDTIHSVHNPVPAYTGAIHVYGGDFVGTPRSQWDPDSLEEQPYDLDGVLREFDRADRAFRRP